MAWKSVPQPGGFMYAVARDVTEQLERENELIEKNIDLEQFTRAVAHDLRAPLRSIGGYAQLLDKELEGKLSSESQQDLKRIQSNAARMGRIFDGLLRFSRAGIQELDKSQINSTEMVAEVVSDLLETNSENKVEFAVGSLPPIQADPPLMRIVFANLISNAMKYSRLRNPAVIEIGFDEDADPPAFFIRDNGAGFDMKDVGRIFGVFERMHPIGAYEGHGIGLATVQRIIHRHGGTIWAVGALDSGATFYFAI